jgi:hypothetical protein
MADFRGRMTADPWAELDERLTQLNSLTMPPNVAKAKARDTLTDVRSGSGGHIEPVDYRGPVTFLRAVGTNNRVFGGEWWFEEALLHRVDHAYSRMLFGEEKARAIRRLLRDGLALSVTWNKMAEFWALEVPAGESLRGYRSRAAPQSLFSGLPVSAANQLLTGGATQIFFPVKNPLWIRAFGSLA